MVSRPPDVNFRSADLTFNDPMTEDLKIHIYPERLRLGGARQSRAHADPARARAMVGAREAHVVRRVHEDELVGGGAQGRSVIPGADFPGRRSESSGPDLPRSAIRASSSGRSCGISAAWSCAMRRSSTSRSRRDGKPIPVPDQWRTLFSPWDEDAADAQRAK